MTKPTLAETAGAVPVSIHTHWFHAWDRAKGTDFTDYEYDLTFADGSTRTVHTIPNEWIGIPDLSKAKGRAAA